MSEPVFVGGPLDGRKLDFTPRTDTVSVPVQEGYGWSDWLEQYVPTFGRIFYKRGADGNFHITED